MIIYLHGFNSSGASAKAKALRRLLQPIAVLAPSYHFDPPRAVEQLQSRIEDALKTETPRDTLMLVGSSLGGFYAQYLARRYGCKLVLINPALDPIPALADYLGENTNFYTGVVYALEHRHLDALRPYYVVDPCRDPVPTLVLLDQGDELLDHRIAFERYQACAEVLRFDGGDHQFQHLPEAIESIKTLYRSIG